jgi:hypothetical protein
MPSPTDGPSEMCACRSAVRERGIVTARLASLRLIDPGRYVVCFGFLLTGLSDSELMIVRGGIIVLAVAVSLSQKST